MMSYDPKAMFNDIAPRSTEPPAPWFTCPGCKVDYSTEAQAKGCHESHARYGRKPTSMFQVVPVREPVGRKSDVFVTEAGRSICGLCASKKVGDDYLKVEMVEPPVCDSCRKQIVPEPFKEAENPNFLPPSERREIRRLGVTRRGQSERFDRRLHKDLRQVEAHSVGEGGRALDERLVKAHGQYRDDPDRGLQTLPGVGYIRIDPESEPVEYQLGGS